MSDHVSRKQLKRIMVGAISLLILTCMATFAAARYFVAGRARWQRPYFRCRICGTGRWQKSGSNRAVITFRASQSIASRMSALKIIGPYVCYPRALRMPTPRLAPRSMSNAFCAAIMI